MCDTREDRSLTDAAIRDQCHPVTCRHDRRAEPTIGTAPPAKCPSVTSARARLAEPPCPCDNLRVCQRRRAIEASANPKGTYFGATCQPWRRAVCVGSISNAPPREYLKYENERRHVLKTPSAQKLVDRGVSEMFQELEEGPNDDYRRAVWTRIDSRSPSITWMTTR